jgi:hypothetical protein
MLDNPNPPVPGPNKPAGTASTTDIAASLTISIAGQPFTLGGKFDNSDVIVEYHADFDKAVSLGSIDSVADEIEKSLNFNGLSQIIMDTNKQVSGLQPLSNALKALETATVRITDIVINTKTKTYGIGLALDFTTSTPLPTVFGITLISFGFSVTRVNKNQAAATEVAPTG